MTRHRVAVIVRRTLLAAACFAALAGLVAACKQQEGERCQVDSDCENDLVCNQATLQCASPNSSGMFDASTPDFLDAELDPDAPIDAMDDAAPN